MIQTVFKIIVFILITCTAAMSLPQHIDFKFQYGIEITDLKLKNPAKAVRKHVDRVLSTTNITYNLEESKWPFFKLVVTLSQGLEWGKSAKGIVRDLSLVEAKLEKRTEMLDRYDNFDQEDYRNIHVDLYHTLVWPKLLAADIEDSIESAGIRIFWLEPLPNYLRKIRSPRMQVSAAATSQSMVDSIPGSPLFNDPLYDKQWNYNNMGQMGEGTTGNDIRVKSVWEKGISGKGVVIAVVDESLDFEHIDIKDQFDPISSLNVYENGPAKLPKSPTSNHGTRCAGQIVAKPNNAKCGVGIASGSKISSIQLLDENEHMTELDERNAFLHKIETSNHIFSNSWGPSDNGKTVAGPRGETLKALQKGTMEGRNGLGTIYIFSSGNGGDDDDCNYDGYSSSEFTIAIGAANIYNKSPIYAEHCSNVIISAYSNDIDDDGDGITFGIATTDVANDCTTDHRGTSASSPQVAGVIALMLEVKPTLTWLDVQNVLILSARRGDPASPDSGWKSNGAGLLSHEKLGFGILDADNAISKASTYSYKSKYGYSRSEVWESTRNLDFNTNISISMMVPKVADLFSLEVVQVTVSMASPHRGYVEYYLTSPMGTKYMIAKTRPGDIDPKPLQLWTFSSVRFWGETPHGNWTLTLVDRRDLLQSYKNANIQDAGQLTFAQIRVRGVCGSPFSLPCRPGSSILQIIQIVSIAVGILLGIILVAVIGARCIRRKRYQQLLWLENNNNKNRKLDILVAAEEGDLGGQGDGSKCGEKDLLVPHVTTDNNYLDEGQIPQTPIFLVSPVTDASVRDRIEFSMIRPKKMNNLIKSISMPMLSKSTSEYQHIELVKMSVKSKLQNEHITLPVPAIIQEPLKKSKSLMIINDESKKKSKKH